MVRNAKLKKHMQELVQSVFEFYKENRSPEGLPLFIALQKLDNIVSQKSNFIECTKLMVNDKTIKALQGKLIGTKYLTIIVENESSCILSFLYQLYLRNPKYNQDLFDEKYSAFEDLFYSDFLNLRESTRLYNFKLSQKEVELAPGISIIKFIEDTTPQEEYAVHVSRPYELFSKSDFLLVREYQREKIIGERSGIDREAIDREAIDKGILESSDLFDLIITSLRILKPSAVYRDHRIESEIMTFHPHGGLSTMSPFYENIAIGEKCNIEGDNIDELRTIVKCIIDEQDSRFTVATRRLSLGMERRLLIDKIIDYMTGLEALYLPDGNEELSFRLSLRVALLLYSDKIERKQKYYFIRKLYRTRSNIIHGNKYTLNTEEIAQLEEILRLSIKLWIKDKSQFSKNEFSRSGKLKSEGKLDTLFFED